MNEFFAMGGYAMWVWSAYALTVVVMVANIIAARNRFRQSLSRMRRLAARSRGSAKT